MTHVKSVRNKIWSRISPGVNDYSNALIGGVGLNGLKSMVHCPVVDHHLDSTTPGKEKGEGPVDGSHR